VDDQPEFSVSDFGDEPMRQQAITTGDLNPLWRELLDAQGTPSAMQMADSVPSSWQPVDEEGVAG